MHDRTAQGNDFFKCDFCRRPWADDRPMVEGHQGSLVCASCLSAAYAAVVHGGEGAAEQAATCTMCLEARDDPKWRSPMSDAAVICRRCIRQSAVTLERDPDHAWTRPAGPGASGETPTTLGS